MESVHRLACVVALLSLAACGGTSTEPTTGALTVTLSTTGDALDPDGYTLTVNADERAIDVNGTVTYADLPSGAQSVALGGVAANCVASPTSPQTVTVVAGETATAAFTVTCEALPADMTLVAADRAGNIYTVDEGTGVEMLAFTPMTDDGAGGTEMLGVISSMARVPSTDAWWFGLGGNSVCGVLDGCVYRLDMDSGSPTMGEAVFVGETGTYAVSGLAVDPETGKIYTFESDGSGPLFELDPVTAGTTIIISSVSEGSSGKGTTFSEGLLYVAGDIRLTEIDIAGGTSALVADFTFVGFTFAEASQTIGSMATRPTDGVVFGIVKDGGGRSNTSTTYLVTIDVATAVVTIVGANTNLLDGLAYIPTAWLN